MVIGNFVCSGVTYIVVDVLKEARTDELAWDEEDDDVVLREWWCRL